MLKEARPDLVVAQFWHIPWPNFEIFGICPWKEEVIEGLLGNDLLAFHIQYHCNNFLDTVNAYVEAKVDWEHFKAIKGGKETLVRPFPISIDFAKISNEANSSTIFQLREDFKKRYDLKGKLLAVSVDRIDYTKGIPERLRAIDRFLEKNPQYIEKFLFIELGVESRIHIGEYRRLNEEVERLKLEINQKYKTKNWEPIIIVKAHHSQQEIIALFGLANVCIVSSLHDGMNLVAKEFIATRTDNKGVLILSEFTGAARELIDAILVNPYALDEMADAIKQAVEMSEQEQTQRMKKMREAVEKQNIYRWAAKISAEIFKFEFSEG
jgi:trehalose 6-phosphate synthase